ncbi:MAG: serine hydrolase [Cyclobacteriaceae bacterium]
MKALTILIFTIVFLSCQDSSHPEPNPDTTYFPPAGSTSWETVDTATLGWNTTALDDLESFVDDADTRALIILKNGRIAFEHYNGEGALGGTFTNRSIWYWASAGKTLTSFLIGKAKEEGLLSLDDKTSDYLGEGWTSLAKDQEDQITVRNQLTMTSGLNDVGIDSDCTNPECLEFRTEPGNRWAYHNAPYTLLSNVVESATGTDFDTYFKSQLTNKIGMDGYWTYLGYNHVYFSTARSMARFGLLVMNDGKWGDEVIMSDTNYFHEMINSSQDINPSYGYLWWLNGKESHMLPGLQLNINKQICPSAPADMISGLGKNGQFVCIVPSEELVVIRMGNSPDGSLVPTTFLNNLWEKVDAVIF